MLIRTIRQWWTQSHPIALQKSQDRLLQNFVKNSNFIKTSSVGLNSVEFRNNNNNNNNNNSNATTTTVILAHGFGSGLGFFYSNIDLLLQSPSIQRVVLVDWLGMGGSDRPSCYRRPIRGWTDATTSWCDSRYTPEQALNFFIEPFHEWIQTSVIERNNNTDDNIILVGHSLGGYLAARYVLKYINECHIDKLVLASPVGFPKKPSNVWTGSQLPTSLRILDAMWSSNITPQQLVRMFGSTRGRRNVYRGLRARIPHLPESDIELLAEYLYHITVAEPSGEYAMNSLLQPGASAEIMGVFAREPLEDRMHILKDNNNTKIRSIKVLFGDHDWMRPNGELSARNTLQKLSNNNNIHTSVNIIPNAGHHLYIENSIDFVRHILL